MQLQLTSSRIEIRLGSMLAISHDPALYLLAFADKKSSTRDIEQLKFAMQVTIIPGTTKQSTAIEAQLTAYFAGTLTTFITPLRLFGTSFQKLVWHKLIQMPYGHTKTYAAHAAAIEKKSAYRPVANANGANPLAIIIPCHRIISSNGTLGGYAARVERKKWLINHEKQFYKE